MYVVGWALATLKDHEQILPYVRVSVTSLLGILICLYPN